MLRTDGDGMQKKGNGKQNSLMTRWGEKLDRSCPRSEYPRPQLRRENWICLNGLWQYAICDADGQGEPGKWDGDILVPFSPESLLSGVGRQLMPGQVLWYRRTVFFEKPVADGRLHLHFGAVDQCCTIYCNGRVAGSHAGGYWPFCLDITGLVHEGSNILTVSVTDDSDTGLQAYGKQKLARGGIWYTAQSGIWQTVWAEYVPQQYIDTVQITPLCRQSAVEFLLNYAGDKQPECCIQVFAGQRIVSESRFYGTAARLPLPDFRYWSPDDPHLYTVRITAGQDTVESYFGMREFGVVRDGSGQKRLALNGKPIFHSGLLDQGYWSDGLYTAPDDEAMIWEISELKKLGFNMLRKHIKIEPLRWYYHCDALGMLVWQDFVSGGGPYLPWVTQILPYASIRLKDSNYGVFGRKNPKGRCVFEWDMNRTVKLLGNAVCIAVWVPFNEGWGQFDACRIAGTLRKLDPTRLIDHASGWHDQKCGDFKSRHIYYKKFKMREDPKGRVQALSEFGGYSCPEAGHMASKSLFGYRMYGNTEELTAAYESLYLNEVLSAVQKGLSASVYTQVSDVEDEINGLFTYDRAVLKLNADAVRRINEELKKAGSR